MQCRLRSRGSNENLFTNTGFFFTLGTHVGSRIIGYLLTDGRPNKSDLDGLVLLEHAVNLLNAPVIGIQFLREERERLSDGIYTNIQYLSLLPQAQVAINKKYEMFCNKTCKFSGQICFLVQ